MASPEGPWGNQVTAWHKTQAPLLPADFSTEEKEQGARPLLSDDRQNLSEEEFQLICSQSRALLSKVVSPE